MPLGVGGSWFTVERLGCGELAVGGVGPVGVASAAPVFDDYVNSSITANNFTVRAIGGPIELKDLRPDHVRTNR